MLSGAQPTAASRVNASSPAFDTEYESRPGKPIRAAIEAMEIIVGKEISSGERMQRNEIKKLLPDAH